MIRWATPVAHLHFFVFFTFFVVTLFSAGLYSLRNSGSLYKKTGDDSPPLMPEELERVIKNLPREPEVVDLFKNLFGAGPLPPR